MEQLRLDRVFRYSSNGIRIIEFPPGEYLIGTGKMSEEVAREAIAGGYGLKVQNRYAKKVIETRERK